MREERIGTWGAAGARFREGLFGPVEKARHGALNQFLVDTQCLLLGAIQAQNEAIGLLALANGWSFLRGFNGCYSGDPPPYTYPSPQGSISGGQCDTIYLVTYEWTLEVAGTFSGSNTFMGPILGSFFEPADDIVGSPAQFGRGSIVHGDPENTQPVVNGTSGEDLVDFRILSVSRQDGQPDDCGDSPPSKPAIPPGRELPSPPSPGDEIAPAGYYDIDVDVGGVNVPITIQVGPATSLGDEGIGIPVDGIPHRLAPDGGIDVGPNPPSDSPSPEPPTKEDTDEIKELLRVPIVGTAEWIGCGGQVEESEYDGEGFTGVERLVQAVLSVVNVGGNEYCPLLEEEEMTGEELGRGSISASVIPTYYDIPVIAGAKAFSVDVADVKNPYAFADSSIGDGDRTQGRYATVSIGYEVGERLRYLEPQLQYWKRGVYSLEEKFGVPLVFRVSIREGQNASWRQYG